MKIITYIAHKRKEDGEIQLLRDHARNTAALSAEFAKIFGAEEATYVCGLSHDLGKYSLEFYTRIEEDGKKCDHATAGAQRLFASDAGVGNLLGYVIMGHHGGMPDYGSKTDTGGTGTFCGRLHKDVPDYSAYSLEFSEEEFSINSLPPIDMTVDTGYKTAFMVRMIYSCLVDADYLDTEFFMKQGEVKRDVYYDFVKMKEQLDTRIAEFTQVSKVNEIRKKILNDCIHAALGKPGTYRLTVPTGGGKTIASVAFAIRHLLHNQEHLRRIIYVIPYCSIIEQNAGVFADIFGEEMVLEHHSNYDFDSEESDINDKKKLACENWDMPLIVTTNLQFFESLYSNKPSKCRKLHNIAGSIIIFDEVQAIPTNYVKPCIRAIQELVDNYHCSAVLCSATQPEWDNLFTERLKPTEICSNVKETFDSLKRTRLINLSEIITQELLSGIINSHQALVILNTKKQTKRIYELVKKVRPEGVYHLSTYMCPENRREVMQEIRKRLDPEVDLPCIVISTNLIEAGVDLDFPKVYRELAGLDSIIQAAGRANREGRRDIGEVYVFSFVEAEYRLKANTAFGYYLKACSDNAKIIMENYEDVFSPPAIKEYYERVYRDLGEEAQDGDSILSFIDRFYAESDSMPFHFQFRELARRFKLMEDDNCSVIIPYHDEVISKLEELKQDFYIPTKEDMRKMQKYTVNIRQYEYQEMLEKSRITQIADHVGILNEVREYKKDTGLEIYREMGIAEFY